MGDVDGLDETGGCEIGKTLEGGEREGTRAGEERIGEGAIDGAGEGERAEGSAGLAVAGQRTGDGERESGERTAWRLWTSSMPRCWTMWKSRSYGRVCSDMAGTGSTASRGRTASSSPTRARADQFTLVSPTPMPGSTTLASQAQVTKAIEEIQHRHRTPLPIDYSRQRLDDGKTVSTHQRIVDEVRPPPFFPSSQPFSFQVVAPAADVPTDAQFYSSAARTKPNLPFLKNHFFREGRIREEHALWIVHTATALLRSEPNVLDVDAPITGSLALFRAFSRSPPSSVCGDIHGQYVRARSRISLHSSSPFTVRPHEAVRKGRQSRHHPIPLLG